MYSVVQVQKAFVTFHRWVREALFAKGRGYHLRSERDLLSNIRFFLLGWFGIVIPEYKTTLFTNHSGKGFFDFLLPGVAIEVAVRGPFDNRSKLTAYTNRDERRKLTGRKANRVLFKRGVLVLLDFSRDPLDDWQLEEYRSTKNLNIGRRRPANFSVLYYFIDKENDNETSCIRKNIRF
jgi:hypothetical protein